ncbi:MAG: DUF1376 domain-containing protein [Sedimentisphaerales bacterium]|nr:DUF1376 domain-containing protein [Sedimentisphaerales bacterium]
MRKINYIQLEPAEVLLDYHTSQMTPEQFGCYWLIVINLYCNKGKLPCDTNELKILCKGSENFESIWKKIETKFQKRNGFLKHKRVTKELRQAKHRMKVATDKGLKGAQARWHRDSSGSDTSIAKKSKVKESKEKQRKEIKRLLNELKTEGDL